MMSEGLRLELSSKVFRTRSYWEVSWPSSFKEGEVRQLCT